MKAGSGQSWTLRGFENGARVLLISLVPLRWCARVEACRFVFGWC